jgi:hypothetical protein
MLRTRLDQIIASLLIVGRGINQIGLKPVGTDTLEVWDAANTARRDLRVRNLRADGFADHGRLWLPRRQCVLHGRVDASGLPNLLSSSGLTITLNASAADPCLVAFANGFDSSGGVDYVGHLTANLVATVPASSTSYLYVERTPSGDSANFTLASTTILPRYEAIAPASPTSGQHWFKTAHTMPSSEAGFTMFNRSGGVWNPVQRVFIGQVTTNASAVTETRNYAYQRSYQSPWTSVAAGTSSTFNHNLGIQGGQAQARWNIICRTGVGADEVAAPLALDRDGSLFYGVNPQSGGAGLNHVAQAFFWGNNGFFFTTVWQTSGQVQYTYRSEW